MSLVERALRKLQESRAQDAAQDHSRPVSAVPLPVAREVQAAPAAAPNPVAAPNIEPNAEKRVWNPSGRVIAIDRDALRTMELLPPMNVEHLIASQYQQIKRSLIASAIGKNGTAIENGHLIMVASALPGEGKTFTSVNLALSMALEQDTDVLLVDADVAKPHISRIFGLQADRGLLDLLVDRNLPAESAILPTNVPGLSILPAGKQIATATEMLASTRMEELVAELSPPGTRRIVLFDSPPLLLSTESRALVHAVGQVVLVVRAQFTARKAVLDAIELLGDTKPISLILNQSDLPPSTGYYGYGSYGDTAPSVTGG